MQSEKRIFRIVVLTTIMSLLTLIYASVAFSTDGNQIDWEKARELLQKQRQGQSLTNEEETYLERARQERAKGRQGSARSGSNRRPQRDQATNGKETTGMIPLTELADGKYKGYTGGL